MNYQHWKCLQNIVGRRLCFTEDLRVSSDDLINILDFAIFQEFDCGDNVSLCTESKNVRKAIDGTSNV